MGGNFQMLDRKGFNPFLGYDNTLSVMNCTVTRSSHYRPQRSWAKVMFLQASVILLTGGVSASVHAGIHPQSRHPPQEQTPPQQTPLQRRHTPRSRHPPRADTPLQSRHPPKSRPPREADSSIRSMSGRYASYWNAFLFRFLFLCL